MSQKMVWRPLLLHPLETSESKRFSVHFRGNRNRTFVTFFEASKTGTLLYWPFRKKFWMIIGKLETLNLLPHTSGCFKILSYSNGGTISFCCCCSCCCCWVSFFYAIWVWMLQWSMLQYGLTTLNHFTVAGLDSTWPTVT